MRINEKQSNYAVDLQDGALKFKVTFPLAIFKVYFTKHR